MTTRSGKTRRAESRSRKSGSIPVPRKQDNSQQRPMNGGRVQVLCTAPYFQCTSETPNEWAKSFLYDEPTDGLPIRSG